MVYFSGVSIEYAEARHELLQQGFVETSRTIAYPNDCDIELTVHFTKCDNERLLSWDKNAIQLWMVTLCAKPDNNLDPTE